MTHFNSPKIDPAQFAAFAQMNDPTQFKDFQAKAQDKVVKGAISANLLASNEFKILLNDETLLQIYCQGSFVL